MREIKLRVIQPGDRPADYLYTTVYPLDESQHASHLIIYKNDIVQQFTGLKDKNGTEIYEGDIVNIDISLISHVKTKSNYEIVWNEDPTLGLGWGCWNLKTDGYLRLDGFGVYEIVGNIYENPELLEGIEQ